MTISLTCALQVTVWCKKSLLPSMQMADFNNVCMHPQLCEADLVFFCFFPALLAIKMTCDWFTANYDIART